MSDERYLSESQQRIVKILFYLGGHEINGLAPGEIAKGLNISPSQVTHDLANLRIAGAAEVIQDAGRWRLSPRLPQIATAMLHGISRAQKKIDEVTQRYRTQPY